MLHAAAAGGEDAVNATVDPILRSFADRVHADWLANDPPPTPGSFGTYFAQRIDRGGYRLTVATRTTAAQRDDLYPLVNEPVPTDDAPHWGTAVGMTIGEVADLLAAIDAAGLRWFPGSNGKPGRIDSGPVEPPNLHVVFDEFRQAWQRDDDEAGIDPQRWYSTASEESSTWRALWQRRGPLTPDGGIAPPDHIDAESRHAGDDGCEGGTAR